MHSCWWTSLYSCMLISGMPGTGKTATVLKVTEALKEAAVEGSLPSFNFVEVNGMKLTDPKQAYAVILKVSYMIMIVTYTHAMHRHMHRHACMCMHTIIPTLAHACAHTYNVCMCKCVWCLYTQNYALHAQSSWAPYQLYDLLIAVLALDSPCNRHSSRRDEFCLVVVTRICCTYLQPERGSEVLYPNACI